MKGDKKKMETENEKYDKWYNSNQERLVNNFLTDNKEFDRMCLEIYETEKKN